MDREALVRRNQQLVEAFHQTPLRHRVRQGLIEIIARFPFRPLTRGWNRVLLIRPDHLGDLLLATPAIRALKDAQPYTEVHVLAGPWAASILGNLQEVDQVLTIDFPGFNRSQDRQPFIFEPYLQALSVAGQLRRIGYGHAIILRPDHWWGAMVAHMAGISERIGYDTPTVQPFLTEAQPFERLHAVQQNLRLVEKWCGPIADDDVMFHFDVYDQERIEVTSFLRKNNVQVGQQIFCIHPGSGTRVKQWQNERWAQVADTLVEQFDAHVIFTGSDNERVMIDQIRNMMKQPSISSAGELKINQLGALYERSLVVVGCDSGPLHLAAAVDTPTVTLFGPADPQEFQPWGSRNRHRVLTTSIACRPCRVLDWGDDDLSNHPCVREIAVGRVLEAARIVVNS